jgi:hypothetical protein
MAQRERKQEQSTGDLARRIVDDVRGLAREHAALAGAEVKETAAESALVTALAAGGAWLAAVGATLLVLSPAFSGRTWRRTVPLSLLYMGGGAVAAALGGTSLVQILSRALDRSRVELKRTADMVKERV